MFNKLLLTTSTSEPAPRVPSSPHECKTSSMKEQDDNQVSSPTQGLLTKHNDFADANENMKDAAVPELILPPSSPPEVTTLSARTKDQIPPSAETYRAHTMDDSIETILSQSMDLASFIRNLELQQEEKGKECIGNNQQKNASEFSFGGCDKSFDGSLSFAASDVDVSLANDTRNIHIESDSSEGKSNDTTSESKKSNNNDFPEAEAEKKSDPETIGLEKPSDPLIDNQGASPELSNSSSKKNRSYNTDDPMPHVSDRLKVSATKISQKQMPTSTFIDTPEPIKSKGDDQAKPGLKMMKVAVFAILAIAFIFGGKKNVSLHDSTERPTSSFECEIISQDKPEFSKVDNDHTLPNGLNHHSIVGEMEDEHGILSSSTGPSDSMVDDDPTQQTFSTRLFEERTMGNYTEMGNLSKTIVSGSDSETRFAIFDVIMIIIFFGLPLALPFAIFRLFTLMFSSSCSSNKSLEMESKMQIKLPSTPTSALLRRKQDDFLTPPLSGKNRAKEPSAWMSPCYGDDALDVSAYKSMKHAEIRDLLRDRKCDTRGNKEQLIKMLIMSYQNELACLTVQQLRPKLRRLKLSQQGTKKDIVRRLVEAGPAIIPSTV